MALIALTSASLPAKRRILSTCVRLFLEKGYHKTTIAEIIDHADVSCSSFQNIFKSKDGVLMELLQFMYENQFNEAFSAAGRKLPPVYAYAAETAIQITLTELNENLRDIYLEAYTRADTLEYIQRATAKMLHRIFGSYQLELTEADFYSLDIGTSGLMRGYMARRCDKRFTLEKKLEGFLTSSLRVLCVPEQEVQQVLVFVLGLPIRDIAQNVMETLFRALAMQYEFSLNGILNNDEERNPGK